MNAQPFISASKKIRIRQSPNGVNANIISKKLTENETACDNQTDDAVISANQAMIVKNHLFRGMTITQPEASRLYGIWRLGARIWDLRRNGMDISTTYIQYGRRRIGQYKLINPF
jgi:hypothetical protein